MFSEEDEEAVDIAQDEDAQKRNNAFAFADYAWVRKMKNFRIDVDALIADRFPVNETEGKQTFKVYMCEWFRWVSDWIATDEVGEPPESFSVCEPIPMILKETLDLERLMPQTLGCKQTLMVV